MPLPSLPPMSNVVPMPKKKETVTITAGGKTTGPIDADKLADAAGKLKASLKGAPPKRPVVEADPAEIAKLEKMLGEEAVAAIRDLDHAELRARIVTLSEHEVETEQSIKRDPAVLKAKDALAEATGPYKETLKYLKARRRLAVLTLAQRGRPASADDE